MFVCMYACMHVVCIIYACINVWPHIDYSNIIDQPGKVGDPARGQLNRENTYFPVPVRAWKFGIAWRVRQFRSASACSSPYWGSIWCLLTNTGFLPSFAVVASICIFKTRHMPSGQSRVYRVTQLRTDGVHCRESAGTRPVNIINQNAPRPSELPPVRGEKMSKRLLLLSLFLTFSALVANPKKTTFYGGQSRSLSAEQGGGGKQVWQRPHLVRNECYALTGCMLLLLLSSH